MRTLTFDELDECAHRVADCIDRHAALGGGAVTPLRLYGVPRGGVSALYLVLRHVRSHVVVEQDPANADFFVDDLVDSGSTAKQYGDRYPGKPFAALITKGHTAGYARDEWLVFPWEGNATASASDAVVRFLQYIGEDPSRGGLLETPARVVKAWDHWFGGYKVDPASVIKAFEDGAENYDEMILVKDIPFYTHCEHHLAPFFGTATFAYVPDKKIVGLSKVSRLIDVFARRLQVQERMNVQIVDAFMKALSPKGAAIITTARHFCMESRGICQQGSTSVMSHLQGCFKEGTTRAEFLNLAK